MNKNSNAFTFGFAAAMVVVVAVLLALAATGLRSYQERNIRAEKMQNILHSIGIESHRNNAQQLFDKHIRKQIVLNTKGEVVNDDGQAFDIDLKKEQDKVKTGNADQQLFPMFVLEKAANEYYVIPVRGKGLWGPIWGYLALQSDMNTIYGVTFDHKSETPGLGAEIATSKFQEQFLQKKIFDESGSFVSVKVVKGGAHEGDVHGVDAISGGTVTSNGVTEMLQRTLKSYIPYFTKNRQQAFSH